MILKASQNKSKIFKVIFIYFLFFNILPTQATHPFVRNFNKKVMSAGSQNWAMTQSSNDWMYFANNNGLLEFDGNRWSTFPIKNYTNVRSVLYDAKDEKIYAGAYNMFGYYSRNKSGLLTFQSMNEKLAKQDRQFTEIWNIDKTDNYIFFQADNDIFRFKGDDYKHFHFDEKINKSAVVHNSLIISQLSGGVSFLSGDIFLPFPNSDILKNKKICAILPYQKNKILFITDFDGIYIFNGENIQAFHTDIDDFMKQNQVFCAAISKDLLAIGTVRNGLIVKNLKDNSNIYSNTQTGMQNNTVLSAGFDRIGNLWLGLDKGIDYVMINSPIYDLFGNSNLFGTGYASQILHNKLYLGTNQGLYTTDFPIKNNSFTPHVNLINNIRGQVWTLRLIDSTLFCGSDHGAFILEQKGFNQIPKIPGTWEFKPLYTKPGYILGSSYSGFFILKKIEKKWLFSNFVKGFHESGGMYEEDKDGKIWFSHWLKGIFRLSLNESLDSVVQIEHFGIENGFPTTQNNTINRIKNRIVFSTERGFYNYNEESKQVEPTLKFQKLFHTPAHSVKIYNSARDDLWAISGSEIKAAFLQPNGDYKVDSASFFSLRDKLIPGFEQASFLNDSNILISTEDGFAVISTDRLSNKPELFKVAIRNVYITNQKDSIVTGYMPNQNTANIPEFDSKHNSIRFEYIGSEYRNPTSIQYSYLLENYDTQWSEFSPVNTKEYTKLGKGSYTFRVRARNLYNSQISETNFRFIILPPWYQSNTAYIVYGLLILMLLFVLIWYIKYRSEKGAREMKVQKEFEMKQQEEKFQADAREKEKEIIALKNQKLQYELRHKSQDLASSTMNLIRKNEILLELNDKLGKISNDISENSEPSSLVKRISKIREEIKVNIEHDNNWKKFQENFDLVYENYLKRLGNQFPVLTVSDKKLCAYLKMDLSSKDIAPLLNMSYRSVEMSRYRLRKKLNLDRDTNLTEFLQKF
ncbi:MAG: triple tyrosine motif-containing protein [Paludibacter sp.]|nr:triple tyrosine motif-containing protein [Paludibacter sp.]